MYIKNIVKAAHAATIKYCRVIPPFSGARFPHAEQIAWAFFVPIGSESEVAIMTQASYLRSCCVKTYRVAGRVMHERRGGVRILRRRRVGLPEPSGPTMERSRAFPAAGPDCPARCNPSGKDEPPPLPLGIKYDDGEHPATHDLHTIEQHQYVWETDRAIWYQPPRLTKRRTPVGLLGVVILVCFWF
jgi:hypothetical protein